MSGVWGQADKRTVRRRRLRLKLDENQSRRAWVRLREAGHEVDTIVDEALSGQSDRAVIDTARYRVEIARRSLTSIQALPKKQQRVRVGDYRVVYEIHDRRLLVPVVRGGRRRQVYL